MVTSAKINPAWLVIVWVGVVTSLIFGASFAPARAAGLSKDAGITLSPPLQQITLGPGILVAKTKVAVTNNTGHSFAAKIQLVDFKAFDQYGAISLGQVGIPIQKYGLSNWMSTPSSNISLASGQSTNVEVDIQNRTDLTPGGHYGAVVIATSSPSNSKQGGNIVGLNQQLVSLVFLKKLGGEQYGLALQSLNVSQKNSSGLPLSMTLLFRSTGNVYVVPRGYIEVTNPHGQVVAKGIINQSSDLIMQGVSRQLVSPLQIVHDSHAAGKYKITAYYRYQGQNGYNQKTVYFNRGALSPLLIISLFTTSVLIFIFCVRLLIRSHKKLPNNRH